ncbi:family 4 glycosyl hydrolase [Paenibacillus sp. YIM B09110]|uniref:family 4 glycosyl hydrolase n=1 Tax=Paenibacillus sp. YIM B09110 TaxID=3126102 RepID=UPI00301D7E84
MKFVLIGGGSFVFAPTVLEDVIVKNRLMNDELVLVDPNAEAVEAMAGAGRRIADKLGVTVRISATTDRRQALAGADYVIVSASPQGARRWAMDYDILNELGMADQARECGGVGGLMNGLRSITLLLDVCRDMEEVCPQARILDVTNPMPRVVTAIDRYTSIQAAGFCNIAYQGAEGYAFLPALVGKKPEDVDIVTAGLNHFAWVVSMKDRKTGEDLLPALISFVQEGDWSALPEHKRRELKVMRRWLEQYGAVAAGAVDHHAEYLPLQEDIHYATTPPYHGTEEERRQRLLELQAIASGESGDWEVLFNHPSWEHPIDVALTLKSGATRTFDILNIRNNGAIPQLPSERIVEVPVRIEGGEWTPIAIPALPDALAAAVRRISDVHEIIAEAAAKGDAALVHQAVDLDPAISNKEAAHVAVDRMLAIHADLLPQFK